MTIPLRQLRVLVNRSGAGARKAAVFVYPNRNFRLLGGSYTLALIGPEIIDEGMYSRDDTRSVMRERERDASYIVSLPLLYAKEDEYLLAGRKDCSRIRIFPFFFFFLFLRVYPASTPASSSSSPAFEKKFFFSFSYLGGHELPPP